MKVDRLLVLFTCIACLLVGSVEGHVGGHHKEKEPELKEAHQSEASRRYIAFLKIVHNELQKAGIVIGGATLSFQLKLIPDQEYRENIQDVEKQLATVKEKMKNSTPPESLKKFADQYQKALDNYLEILPTLSKVTQEDRKTIAGVLPKMQEGMRLTKETGKALWHDVYMPH